MSVGHYENFPVASWLCPPRLRPAVVAIYRYARTADDLADEGDAPAAQRLADLALYRADLHAAAGHGVLSNRWPDVFDHLGPAIVQWRLPLRLLDDLLSAFEQDLTQHSYRDRSELLDYCRRSANPVGRLLLHLYRIDSAQALRESDAICSALQLINFWQDVQIDTRRRRLYLPHADCARHGVDPAQVLAGVDSPALRTLIADEVAWARALMCSGAPLVHRIAGRAGWELRLVVHGGLRILDKIEAMQFDTLKRRPTVTAADAPVLLWRALRMSASRMRAGRSVA